MKRLTPAEVAEILRCDRDKVLTLIHAGQLRAINVSMGKSKPRWIIRLEDVEAFENSRCNFGGGEKVAKPRRLPPVKDYFAGAKK